MDAKSGYHQLPLREEEAELTAFVVPWGHYEFVEGTPFGLKGAGYSFQRCMATILGSNFILVGQEIKQAANQDFKSSLNHR